MLFDKPLQYGLVLFSVIIVVVGVSGYHRCSTKFNTLVLIVHSQISWLNDYHVEVLEKVGPVLQQQGKQDVYRWLVQQTQMLG